MVLNKKIILTMSFTLITALIILCIVGAFLGAEPTERAFSSVPFAVFWIAFIAILLAGIFSFRNIFTKPAMFAMHFGFVLIILGSMSETENCIAIADKFGIGKIHRGKMILFEGQNSNIVRADPYGITKMLPFSVKLNDFRVEYYPKQSPAEPNSVRGYFSDVEIIEDANVVRTASIAVNKPLHYAGYHFYQFGLDENMGRYTIIEIVSDTGVIIVYVGFVFVCIGTFWHFWFERLTKKRFQ
ncbi:MAG: cytochrome c biogenesis protein ResB [Sedimentisphaerales bacterium]